jgi:hypothetical protein
VDTSATWRRVEWFESPGPDALDRAVGLPGVRRFRTDAGGRAALLPATVLAEAARQAPRQTVGLVPEPDRVSLPGPDGAMNEYLLLAPTAGTPAGRRLASGPRPGEDPDALDARGRWFDARHRGGR